MGSIGRWDHQLGLGYRRGKLTLEFEGEVICEMATFVVSAQQEQGIGVPYLETPQVEHALDTKVPSIDVVAQEEVSGICRVATNFEQLHEVVL
jgi:hypothetical protein